MTFDLDANGILNVTARDKATGREQKITITASSGLSKEEVERMVREAERHAQEDRQRREEIETRNRADSLAYQAERTLQDLGRRSRLAYVARLRTRSGPCAMRLQAAISRASELPPMTWSARCNASARRPTVNLEHPRAMEHPAQHPPMNLGPSRESTAKSRQPPPCPGTGQ